MTISEICMIETRWWVTPEEAAAAARQPDGGSGLDQRLLGNRDFFMSKSLTELAREQGVEPIKDIRVFAGGLPEDADVDELIAQLEELRSS